MKYTKLNPFLVHRLLGQALVWNTALPHSNSLVQRRFYRHGPRAEQGGFYVSPKWYDQTLLTSDGNVKHTAPSILKSEGIVSLTNKIFNEEKARQRALLNRVEKIEVQLEKSYPNDEDVVLMMNRDISTPYDCAAHISQLIKERSALAIVDGTDYWHMHQPLNKSCHLKLLHYKHAETLPVNYAFWRSCSMLLASVVKKAFKEQFQVQIMSSPISDLTGGSFVCDAVIPNLTEWNPTKEDLRIITSMLWDEVNVERFFERLEVDADTASTIFADDPSRLAFVESKAQENAPFVLYRVGDYIELCKDPMISSTSQISSVYLSAIHPLKTANGDQFYRFQGVALPRQLKINAYAYTLIRDRSKQLNQVGLNC